VRHPKKSATPKLIINPCARMQTPQFLRRHHIIVPAPPRQRSPPSAGRFGYVRYRTRRYQQQGYPIGRFERPPRPPPRRQVSPVTDLLAEGSERPRTMLSHRSATHVLSPVIASNPVGPRRAQNRPVRGATTPPPSPPTKTQKKKKTKRFLVAAPPCHQQVCRQETGSATPRAPPPSRTRAKSGRSCFFYLFLLYKGWHFFRIT